MTITKLSNLINPEVMSSFIDKKLVDLIKFAPLAEVGHELEGTPGNTITVPAWEYVGDAEDLAEGAEGQVSNLSATSKKVTVKKAVKNIGLTDESVLSGYGRVIGQAELQLATSIANKIDNDCYEALKAVTKLTHTGVFGIDYIADALVKFGEDMDDAVVLMINAKNYAILRKSPEFVHIANGQAIMNGQVGYVYGCAVVVSNKVQDGECYFVKPGALGIEIKREISFETERQVTKKTTIISVDKHYVAYVKDDSRVIKGTITVAESTRKAKVKDNE